MSSLVSTMHTSSSKSYVLSFYSMPSSSCISSIIAVSTATKSSLQISSFISSYLDSTSSISLSSRCTVSKPASRYSTSSAAASPGPRTTMSSTQPSPIQSQRLLTCARHLSLSGEMKPKVPLLTLDQSASTSSLLSAASNMVLMDDEVRNYIPVGNADYEFYACVNEQSSQRALSNQLNDTNSVEDCLALGAAYPYVGLEYGGQCFAGYSFDDTQSTNQSLQDCNITCPHGSEEYCGGVDRIQLVRVRYYYLSDYANYGCIVYIQWYHRAFSRPYHLLSG